MLVPERYLLSEANFIVYIQKTFGERNAFLLRTSKVSDPAYIMTILFPVFSSLDSGLGCKVLLVSSITEWLNTILKWILMEPRPYWWVREANANVAIQQAETTCDTAPGSPSGHVMCTAAFLYVIISWLRQLGPRPAAGSTRKRCADFLLWLIFTIAIVLVSLSRINIAAHFPHQCILGALLGVGVSKFLIDNHRWAIGNRLQSVSKIKMFLVAAILSILSFSFYWLQQILGYDPGWSIKLAFKWCIRPETISVNTTPIYSLVRDCGSLFGIAIAWPIKERRFYPFVGAVVATLFFVATRLLHRLMPTNDALQFYTFHFLENLYISLCLLTIVPYIASLVKLKEKNT